MRINRCLAFDGEPGGSAQGQADKDELIPVNIGLPVSNYWPGYVARDLDLFEQAGLKPTFYMFTSGAPLIAAMKSGSLDVAWTGLATLFMVAQGIPLTYLYTPLNSSSQEGMVVNPQAGIDSFRDIAKAKAVGAPTATCAHIATVLAAKDAGVAIADVNRVNASPETLETALDRGRIDAAFIWGPWSLKLQAAGYPVVSWDRDYNGEVCATNVAARPQYLRQHPEVGCRLVKVQAMTLKAVQRDPELAIKSLQNVLGLDYALARQTYETLEIPSLESQLDPDSDWSLTADEGGLVGKLYRASVALTDAKAFRKPVALQTIQEAVDPAYVREFQKTGCKG